MKVLVFNAGSSSLKFGIFDLGLPDSRVLKGEFEGFHAHGSTLRLRAGGEKGQEETRADTASNLSAAFTRVPAILTEFGYNSFDAIGHRVVHGGPKLTKATLIDEQAIRSIEDCLPLAPLHNPLALVGIRLSATLWPAASQVAVFDTAYHQTIPDYVYTYAVPAEWRKHGLRRYGFHGTSHQYVAMRVAQEIRRPLQELRIISCHLGNGASVCAISHGSSFDTSMGMTPLEGLVMGTRAGDVDPGIFTFLAREFGLDADAIEQRLNTEGGLKALAGTADLREIERAAAAGDTNAQLAIHVYAYRVRKYIGAYAAAMGGVDVVAFTGGIGENSANMRRRICERLEFLGLYLDTDRNHAPILDDFAAPQIQASDSRVRLLVTRTNEQYMIARETAGLLEHKSQQPDGIRIPVAVSARHVHLTQPAVEWLFGKGYQLTLDHNLSQPEGWAAAETVELIGPRGALPKVRVLGPTRSANQVEVSHTDTFTLGVDVPLRDSGELDRTPEIRVRGPAGELTTNGLIVAARHIHLNSADALRLGLRDGQYVDVNVDQGERAVTFAHTRIRVKDSYVTEMHIDTDEANAAGITGRATGELILHAGDRPSPALRQS